jgi:predicted dehydrogenase
VTRLRFGLIGCGGIATHHIASARQDGRVEIVAYADIRQGAARTFLETYGGDYASDTADRVISDDSLDGVIIATHHDSHASLARMAVRAGRHVLLEKPMARNTVECLELAEDVELAGVHLAVNYKFRLEPEVRRAREAVPRPTILHAQFAGPAIEADSVGAWVFDPDRGGGLINATGCHMLDLLLWFARSEPIWCSATASEGPEWHSNLPDALVATIRFASGALATVIVSDRGENAYVSRWFFECFDGSNTAVLFERMAASEISGSVPNLTSEDEAPDTMVASLVEAILTGRPVDANVEDGLAATWLAESLVKSAIVGPLELSDPRHRNHT